MKSPERAPRVLPPRPHVAVGAWRRDQDGTIAAGMDQLGRWLLESRVQAGMSQSQLGRLVGLHRTTISRLERGRLEGLKLYRLAVIIAVLRDALGGGLRNPFDPQG